MFITYNYIFWYTNEVNIVDRLFYFRIAPPWMTGTAQNITCRQTLVQNM